MKKKRKLKNSKIKIGWREYISIPTFGIKRIKIKVDTGARTSALHVTDLILVHRGKTLYAEFKLHPNQQKMAPHLLTRKRVEGHRLVKSSNGQSEKRPLIHVDVVFGEFRKTIEVTLTNRDLMGFRMLLGRTALKGNFIIDPSRSYLLTRSLPRKKSV
jgi:hypothetical protein